MSVAGTDVSLRQETDYPWCGTVRFTLSPKSPAEFAFAVRSLDRGKTWSEVPVSELSFPSGIRHGTAFAVDKSVVDALAR